MFVEEIQFVTLSVFDLAISSIFMTARHSAPLICSTSELNFAILIFQCSSSAIGPVSSASFRICSLSANTCETKTLHFHCYMCIKLWNRRRVEFILGPRELQTHDKSTTFTISEKAIWCGIMWGYCKLTVIFPSMSTKIPLSFENLK